MVDLATSMKIAAFMPAAWRRRVAACGGLVHDVDGLAVCLTGVPLPPFNPTLIERSPADPDAALADAESLYAEIGLPFGIDLETALHGPVRDAAVRAGLHLEESRPGMSVAVSDVPAVSAPDGVELVRVEDASLLDLIVEVDAAAFGGDAAITRLFVPDAVLQDPTQRVYGARIDGRMVAAGESTLLDGILGVFGIATHPAFRHRGIGTALTAFLIADRAAEADLAVLDASDLGRGVYERLGFEAISTWEVWVRTGDPTG